jgi:hypothetical protein
LFPYMDEKNQKCNMQNDNSIHIREIVFREDIAIKPLF